MWKKAFEALERNRAWRVFRHAKALGDIFSYFGVHAWITSVVAIIAGGAVTWIASLSIWAKVLVGLSALLLVLLVAFVASLLLAARSSEEDPKVEEVARKGGWGKGVFGGCAIVAALSVAAVMSTKPRSARPTSPSTQPDQTAQVQPIPPASAPTSPTTPLPLPSGYQPSTKATQVEAPVNGKIIVEKSTVKTQGAGTPVGGNSGSVGPVTQGPCSNLQVGGSNNQATTNCTPIPFRTLTEPQKHGIRAFVNLLPATVLVTIGSVTGSGDGDTYALEFFPLFEGHHLGNETTPTIRTGFPATFTNVWVATVSDSDTATQYRDGLVDALVSLGIPAHKAERGKIAPGNLELLIGFRPEEVKPR